MKAGKIVIRSFWHYRKRNSLLALGIAISTAVLTGALIVGDSVKYSLNRIAVQRLGETTHVLLSGDRYFSSDLAERLANDGIKNAAVLQTQGLLSVGGGELKANKVNVLGVDGNFDQFAGMSNYYASLKEDSVIISENLARALNLKLGDDVLLRMTRSSLIPLNAPFVSDAENVITVRAGVSHISGAAELGFFNIRNSQTAAYNVFVSAKWLREEMEIGERANLLLFANESLKTDELKELISNNFTMEDASLILREQDSFHGLEIISERVFIEEEIAHRIVAETKLSPILTYFVNSISTGSKSTPYSFVTTTTKLDLGDEEIIITDWLANDLDVLEGDQLELSYYNVGPLRELEECSRNFMVKKIVSMNSPMIDAQMMPEIPGLSTAGNCRDWDAGVPVDLGSIRDKDEDYWTRYKGTPKAVVSLDVAREMWGNRFGEYTALRGSADSSLRSGEEGFERRIMSSIEPEILGFELRPVRDEANYAANNGVSFSQLFAGLSFFLIIGALLLCILLFQLNLVERKEQLKIFKSVGVSRKTIRSILVAEGMLIAMPGVLFGLLLSVLYNQLIFTALNGIWSDIVRTQMLEVQVKPLTLLYGGLLSVLVSFVSLYWPAGNFLKKVFRSEEKKKATIKGISFVYQSIAAFVIALLLVLIQVFKGELQNASVFFLAGGLLLYSGIIMCLHGLKRSRFESVHFGFNSLSMKNAVGNVTRSMAVIVLFSIATFLVISTGSNKKDLFINAGDRSSGSGGFLYYAESTSPVLYDLNDDDVVYDYGLPEGLNFVQIRMAEGDDASCLNLNKIVAPRILGVDAGLLEGRFSFVTSVPELDDDAPWRTLQEKKYVEVIPAVADETVIKWGLGMSVGDTLHYKDALGEELCLLLVGGLAPSIFQGSVLISDENFLKHFPSSSGSNIFLIEGEIGDTALLDEELNMAMRDFGWNMSSAPERLAEFNSITNTYLSIFMALGALGLLLGTVGLSVLLYRSVIERRTELALLKALGFSRLRMRKLLSREYSFLLVSGVIIGTLSAIVATLPSLLSENTDVSFGSIAVIVVILLTNGLLWIWWMSGVSLKKQSLSVALRNE